MSHCGYAGWGLHNCTHKEDAVVRCWNNDAAWNRPRIGGGTLQGRFVSAPERHDGTNRIKAPGGVQRAGRGEPAGTWARTAWRSRAAQ